MVIEDVTRPHSSPTVKAAGPHPSPAGDSRRPYMAAPIDRLAAVMADFVLLLPLVSLLTAPFRKHWELARLLRDSHGLVNAFLGIFGLAVVAIILYQTVSVAMWGATPGKRLLGLRIISFWTGGRPTLMQAFLRALFWCVEAIFAFLPWLGVMSNERRRPWHDRIADTEVSVVNPGHAVGPPDAREASFSKSVYAATLSCVAAVFAVGLLRMAKDINRNDGLASSLVDEHGFLCSAVTEAHEEWLAVDEGEPASRLDVALALFGAQAIGDRCLEAEADFALWNGKAGATAYVAKGLVVADDSEAHLAYSRKGCEVDAEGPACQLARLLAGAEEKSSPAFEPLSAQQLLQSLTTATPAYIQVYLVRHLLDQLRFNEALQLIDRGSPHRRLGFFYASHRARSLWGLHRWGEARVAFRSSLEGLNAAQRTRLATWFCDVESATSCSRETTLSCALLDRAIEKSPAELEDTDTAIAWIRGRECAAGAAAVDYVKMQGKVPGAAAQSLLAALTRLQSNDKVGARNGLVRVLSEADEDSAVWFEAQARLIALAESEVELKDVVERWSKDDSGDAGWVRIGHQLVQRFDSLGLTRRSLEIGTRVLQWDPFDTELQKRLVVAAYRMGDLPTATKLLGGMPTTERAPASVAAESDFERVLRDMAQHVAPVVVNGSVNAPVPAIKSQMSGTPKKERSL